MFQESRISWVPADQVAIIAVKETKPEEIMPDEFISRAKQDGEIICFLTPLKTAPGLDLRKAVDLADVIFNRQVGIMQQIAF